MYVLITNTDPILYHYLLVSDSFNENEDFNNNYEYHKLIKISLSVQLIKYRLHHSEITDTNTKNNDQYQSLIGFVVHQ